MSEENKPEVVDRELPYTFDLLWDLKRESRLRQHLQNAVSDLVGMNEAMRQYEFKLEWDTSFEVTPQQMDRIAWVSKFIKDPTDDGWNELVKTILERGVRLPAVTSDDHAKPFECFVQLEHNGLAVGMSGLGLLEMETGYEAIACFEYWEGDPRLLLWPNIRHADPEIIDLSRALETNRKPEDE